MLHLPSSKTRTSNHSRGLLKKAPFLQTECGSDGSLMREPGEAYTPHESPTDSEKLSQEDSMRPSESTSANHLLRRGRGKRPDAFGARFATITASSLGFRNSDFIWAPVKDEEVAWTDARNFRR